MIGKLERFKRVALSCEKTARNFASFVALARHHFDQIRPHGLVKHLTLIHGRLALGHSRRLPLLVLLCATVSRNLLSGKVSPSLTTKVSSRSQPEWPR